MFVILQRLQQGPDPLAGWLPSPFLATFDLCDLGGLEEGSEPPRSGSVTCGATCGRGGFNLLEQPGALLTQSHETGQLRGVDVLADVQGDFEGVLDVQRGDLRLVLLFALEKRRGTKLADENTFWSSGSYKSSPVCTVCSGPSLSLVTGLTLFCCIWGT